MDSEAAEEAEESVVSLFKLELVLQADKQKVSAAVISNAIVRCIITPHKNRVKCPDRVELSIMVLQTIATPHGWARNNAPDEVRTRDIRIKSPVLYQLSYRRRILQKRLQRASDEVRTRDIRIKSPVLYQLSYRRLFNIYVW